MPGTITDQQQFQDESVIEDFYRMLPLFFSLFKRRPSIHLLPNGLPFTDGFEYVLDEDKVMDLLSLYEKKKHLTVSALKLLDNKSISKPTQRLIRTKQK